VDLKSHEPEQVYSSSLKDIEFKRTGKRVLDQYPSYFGVNSWKVTDYYSKEVLSASEQT
jgi:hypothetical protein